MKVQISDKNYLQAISPAQISAYLRSNGGIEIDDYRGKATVWKYGNEELLVPFSTAFADYAFCVSAILQTLEQEEGRSQLDILLDLNSAASHDKDMQEKEFYLDIDAEIVKRDFVDNSITIAFADGDRIFSLDRLEGDVLEDFQKEFYNNFDLHSPPIIPLRLTGIFKGGVFKRGYVDGVGEPREGAMDIQSASLASASMEEDAEQESAE